MRYLLAILVPPLGMLSVGKTMLAILCLILWITLIGWPIAAIWAVLVVHGALADKRQKEMLAEMQKQSEAQIAASKAAADAAQALAQAQSKMAEAQAAQAQTAVAQIRDPQTPQE
jgi:hypothetical protein